MRFVLYSLRVVLLLSLLILEIRADPVDRYIKEQLKKQKAPGLSLAVLRNGKIVKAKGYGLANVELNVPATPNTAYQLASLTKQFTAAAIMLLVDDGKVQLSDRVTTHVENLPTTWSNITVRHLLSMTSGIKDYFKHIPTNGWEAEYTCERIISLVAGLPLDFAPGDQFDYSNSNYVLLAMIIRAVSHQTYDAFLAERVFRPLGMRSTRCENPAEILMNRASLYDWRSNRLVNVPYLNPSLWDNGDGGLRSTVIDLGKWDAALAQNRVLSTSPSEALWTLGKFNNGRRQGYGFGWDTGEQHGHRWVSHSGGRFGAFTRIIRLLDERLTVIVLMNGPGNAYDIAFHVAGMYLPGLTFSSIKPGRDRDPKLSLRLQQCLTDLAQTGDSDLILPQFREECAKAKHRIAEIQKRIKGLKSFTFVSSEKVSPSRTNGRPGVIQNRSYKVVSDEGTRFFVFELTQDNRVAWCDSVPD